MPINALWMLLRVRQAGRRHSIAPFLFFPKGVAVEESVAFGIGTSS
jgi:hypothetical protein